jgi:hypothetical protein
MNIYIYKSCLFSLSNIFNQTCILENMYLDMKYLKKIEKLIESQIGL